MQLFLFVFCSEACSEKDWFLVLFSVSFDISSLKVCMLCHERGSFTAAVLIGVVAVS